MTPSVPSHPANSFDRSIHDPSGEVLLSRSYPLELRSKSGYSVSICSAYSHPILRTVLWTSPTMSSRSQTASSPSPSRRRNLATVPSERTLVTRRKLSRVVPCLIECAPAALFATIPPMVHVLEVDGSGAKYRPYRSNSAFKSSRTTPGCTVAVISSGSMSTTSLRCLEQSTMRPLPIAFPVRLEPAPRAVILTSYSRANATTCRISS